MRFERRFVPRSDRSDSGTPKQGITSSASSLAILSAFWSGTANAEGHLVKRSWTTTTCLFPLSVRGKSLT